MYCFEGLRCGVKVPPRGGRFMKEDDWVPKNEAKGEGSVTYDGKTTSAPTHSTKRVTWRAQKNVKSLAC